MRLQDYLIERIFHSSHRPGETEELARIRHEAIKLMFQAYDPKDDWEALTAARCVRLEFLADAALRAASESRLDPEGQMQARAAAESINRTLDRWVSRLISIKKRNEARAQAARKAAQSVHAVSSAPEPIPEPVAAATEASVEAPAPLQPAGPPRPDVQLVPSSNSTISTLIRPRTQNPASVLPRPDMIPPSHLHAQVTGPPG